MSTAQSVTVTSDSSMPVDPAAVDSVNSLRCLAIDAVERANSGHPGLPMGAAPMAYALWQNHLRHNPNDPSWPDRDRFILSAGHGSMLLYSLLHHTGYDLSLEDIQSFRQWDSKTPGHPEAFITTGVEATTGPLGQGTANAVGMALAERALAHRFNRAGHTIVDHHTFALVSDGDLMEGIAYEAIALAGHLKLGKLVYLYDANDISLDGPLSMAFSENVGQRFEAAGWHVLTVADGDHDVAGLTHAISLAKAETERPSLIIVRTTIGYGSPNKQGTAAAHGAPLGDAETRDTKAALGWDPERSFHVPETVRTHMNARQRGEEQQRDWQARFDAYAKAHPELAAEWHAAQNNALPEGWDAALPSWSAGDKAIATRSASGDVIQALAKHIPWFIGGDADLSCSTKTAIKGGGSFNGSDGSGRNIHFGVREHAMGAIANGMAYHGGLLPYVSTFFVFSDYMRPAVRLAALNQLPVTCVWTHDSVGVGEDGPTHQPVEHLMSLRAMPGLAVIRPADANETREAWKIAVSRRAPVALVLSRQNLPILTDGPGRGNARDVARGAYVLADAATAPKLILIATGSEVALAIEAQQALQAKGVPTRVVSMPCWELFAEQDQAYRDSVLPPAITARLAIEAGCTLGWERFVGRQEAIVGIDRFGASAPGGTVFAKLGFSVENIVARAEALL